MIDVGDKKRGERTPVPGALPQAMMNIAFGEKRPITV
jgi:hypothetical protein